MFTFIYRKPSDCIISSNHPNRSSVLFRPTLLFRPIIQIVRPYYFVPTLLFRPIIQIVRPYYFVRLYYFLRSSNLPFNVQFSSSYFALFLYLNTNLIQIKSRTRTFPETATRSLRPRRTYCNNVVLMETMIDTVAVKILLALFCRVFGNDILWDFPLFRDLSKYTLVQINLNTPTINQKI